VQLTDDMAGTEAGAQTRLESVGSGAFSVSTAVLDELLKLAVTVAELSLVSEPAAAAKLAEVDDAGTVTDAGTVSRLLFEAKVTTAPAAGAALLRTTVQLAVAPEVSAVGAHCRLVRVGSGATSVMDAVLELLFSAALIVAVPSAVMVPALAAKMTVVFEAGTVTVAGTETPA
jgi:hypothetical protein